MTYLFALWGVAVGFVVGFLFALYTKRKDRPVQRIENYAILDGDSFLKSQLTLQSRRRAIAEARVQKARRALDEHPTDQEMEDGAR